MFEGFENTELSIEDKIEVTKDIFRHSHSKEYQIFRDRILRQRQSTAAPPSSELNSFGLVNLSERKIAGIRNDPNDKPDLKALDKPEEKKYKRDQNRK